MAKQKKDLKTTEQAAAELGISVHAFLKRASRRGIQPAGKQRPAYLWSPNSIAAVSEIHHEGPSWEDVS